MPKSLRLLAFGVITIGLWGCGGGDTKPQEGANNAAPAGAAGGAPAGGAPAGGGPAGMAPGGGGPGGMGPGGMGPGGMGRGGPGGSGDTAKASASSGSGSSRDLVQFIPEGLTLAAGANFAVLSDKATPFGSQLLEQFEPALKMLAKAGVKKDQIDQLWSGTNRNTGDMVTCVRTKGELNASGVTKALGAGKGEKVGRANMHPLSNELGFDNAVAYVDSK